MRERLLHDVTWAVPSVWPFALLALAAYRTWKLIAEDTILDRPRDALTARMGEKAEIFVSCPWCAGFWILLAWWLAWQAWPHWTLVATVPFALSAIVGALALAVDRLTAA